MAYQTVNIGDITKAILADQVSTPSSYTQAFKEIDPTDDSTTPFVLLRGSQITKPVSVIDSAGDAMEFSAPDELTAAPSIGTAASVQYDSLHTTIMTFAGAARAAGKTGRILGGRLVCKHDSFTGIIVLHLFRKSFTGTTAQDVLAVSDTDKLEDFGALVFDFSTVYPLGGGRVAMADRKYLPLDYKCDAGTSAIYGVMQLVSAAGVTFAASDLVPFMSFLKD
jgi:hypothetical protein